MKNPEHVAQLLAELRELADNDFERHRIDVLERDLTAPPAVEIIDDKHQMFDGVIFTKRASGHYAKNYSPIHQVIYRYYHGNIPDDNVIHHIDHNPANNRIENLQSMTAEEHSRFHNNEAIYIEINCATCGKSFKTLKQHPSTYCSDKCREQQYMETRTCEICGKTFSCFKYSPTTTCSPKCASELRRVMHRPKAEFSCIVCGAKFVATITGRNKFCSKACAQKAHYQESKIKHTCPCCGKEFIAAPQTICCSRHCAQKYRRHPKSVLK